MNLSDEHKQGNEVKEKEDEGEEERMPQFARRKRYNKITGLENTKDSKITRQNKIKKPDLSIESGKDHEEA